MPEERSFSLVFFDLPSASCRSPPSSASERVVCSGLDTSCGRTPPQPPPPPPPLLLPTAAIIPRKPRENKAEGSILVVVVVMMMKTSKQEVATLTSYSWRAT